MTGIMLMGEITSSDARWHSGWRHCARRRKEVSPLAPLTTHDSSIVSFFQEHAVVFMVELPRAAPLPLVDVTEGGKTPVELPVPITGLCVPKQAAHAHPCWHKRQGWPRDTPVAPAPLCIL